jgi:hypothetical protein
MDIKVGVVDVNVPAEDRPHMTERGRVVGQAGDLRAVGDRAEQVHRPVRAECARLGHGRVHPVDRLAGVCGLIRAKRTRMIR